MADDFEIVEVNSIDGFVTNMDTADIPKNYAIKMRGLRNSVPGKFMQRDYGTKNSLTVAQYATITGTLVSGFVLRNKDTGLSHQALVTVSGGSLKVYIDTAGDGSSFVELTEKVSDTISSITNELITLTTSGGKASNYYKGWIIVNATRSYGRSLVIASSTATPTVVTTPNYMNGVGGWTTSDTVYLYRNTAFQDFSSQVFDPTVGSSPLIRWLPVEPRTKVTLLATDTQTSGVLTAKPNFVISREAERGYFYSGGSASFSLSAGFFAEPGNGFTPSFSKFGDEQVPLTEGGTGTTYAATVKEHLYDSSIPSTAVQISVYVDETAGGAGLPLEWVGKVAATLVYNGYQETEPVMVGFWNLRADGTLGFSKVEVNAGAVRKGLTSVRLYVAEWYHRGSAGFDDPAYVTWARSQSNFYLRHEISLVAQNTNSAGTNINWALQTGSYLAYGITLTPTDGASVENRIDLLASLGRAYTDLDSRITPAFTLSRFATLGSRSQGSAVVRDNGETELRVAPYDGTGAHCDDLVATSPFDSNAVPLTLSLSGRGKMMGIDLHNEQVHVLRQTDLETIDLQSGLSSIVPIDCVSYSIIRTPYGLAWAGRGAIWFLSNGSSEVVPLNLDWLNMYTGVLTLNPASATPYISEAARSGAILGYDEFFNELYVELLVRKEDDSGNERLIFRYSFIRKNWSVREISVASGSNQVLWFDRWSDGRLMIGCAARILLYPANDVTGLQFEDDLTKTGASTWVTAAKGVVTSARINLDTLNGTLQSGVPVGFAVETDAISSSASDTFAIDTYANEETTAFDSKTQRVGDPPKFRRLTPRGMVRSLQQNYQVSSGSLVSVDQFDINSVTYKFRRKKRSGNR